MSDNDDRALRGAVLTCAHMARADAWTIDRGYFPGIALMEHAGVAVARVLLQRFGDARRVVVLCGPGNNGGDGYVAARILAESGMKIALFAFGEPKPGSDAASARDRCRLDVSELKDFEPKTGDVFVDAIFGAGLSRKPDGGVLDILDRLRTSGCPVIAVDLPSGVNGDSGMDLGGAVPAEVTVTFFRKKPGHLLFPGRVLCGETIVADIGVNARVFASDPPTVFENGPDLWAALLPRAGAEQHKYSRGHAAVFSGPRHATGASRLAAMAAQRAGAGAVTIIGGSEALDVHAAHVTSIMLRDTDPRGDYETLMSLRNCRACVLGPGFGDRSLAREVVWATLGDAPRSGIRLVLDADGISAFSENQEELFTESRKLADCALVLTPHEGEFGRLFPDLAADEGLSKLERARKAAERAQAVVIYKGPDTVVASPDGRAAINSNATPALATAGSGDVLAGIVAGLLAQGMPLWEAAAAAVWIHGEAGRAAGPYAIAEDLVTHTGKCLAGLLQDVPSIRA